MVLDTSVIIDGEVTKMIEAGDISSASQIIIPLAVLDELQSQASSNKEHGFVGLSEIKKIREQCLKKKIDVLFVGARPTLDDIRLAKHGRIDALIKDVAMREGATLVTADYVQALVAEAQGVQSMHVSTPTKTSNLEFEKYFDDNTMSVHLKEGVLPMGKKGKPGNSQLVKLGEERCSYSHLTHIIEEISEASRVGVGSVEISLSGATVIQYGRFRIAITRPPFSDGLELTIVKPIVKLALADYNANEKLMDRLSGRAEGIIISGPPGSGKSTLASSLAEFYLEKGKIVKTFESPRDLQVPAEVTQYGHLEGGFDKAVDILLLVRPDYTIFDEVRRAPDFEVFSDMRLAGVGMVGVVHASSPLDAIQRFIGKVELGMIPHIIDTIIFVKSGSIQKVYDVSLTVKVPTGMQEADLARPLVEVRDFNTGEIQYEIYTFGEENVVVPTAELNKKIKPDATLRKLAESRIRDVIRRFDSDAEINILSENRVQIKVTKEAVPLIIGRGGSTVSELEKMLGISIDVEAKTPALGNEINFNISEVGSSVTILINHEEIGKNVNIYIDDEFVFTSQVGKKSRIKIDKRSDNGRKIINAFLAGRKIRIFDSRG
ncbi:MAG TPA: PINc/VapC family ATPase [Candidatus Nitrosopolaris sp.]|nr:PINc/VapC family ATPase [Candidatus Nitrosopolaris sp.]